MKNNQESSEKYKKGDNLADMPKGKPGERVKYLLKKYGMTQKELALKMYDGDETKSASQITNINAKLNDKRAITAKDAKKIAEIFKGTFPQFILDGGYENAAEQFAAIVEEGRNEATLLYTALISLMHLSGLTVKQYGLKKGDIFTVLESIKDYAVIEREGKEITLSVDQISDLENIVFKHAEIAINHYLDIIEKEQNNG